MRPEVQDILTKIERVTDKALLKLEQTLNTETTKPPKVVDNTTQIG